LTKIGESLNRKIDAIATALISDDAAKKPGAGETH
jgi:hypothetical protein